MGRLPNAVVEELVRAGRLQHEPRADGLPHGRMDLFRGSFVYDSQRANLRIVTETGELFERFLGCDRQLFQFADHKIHHVVGESSGPNLRRIPYPRSLVRVEFQEVFLSESGEELDREERVPRSFFVHQPRKGTSVYPLTTQSIATNWFTSLSERGLRTISFTIAP